MAAKPAGLRPILLFLGVAAVSPVVLHTARRGRHPGSDPTCAVDAASLPGRWPRQYYINIFLSDALKRDERN